MSSLYSKKYYCLCVFLVLSVFCNQFFLRFIMLLLFLSVYFVHLSFELKNQAIGMRGVGSTYRRIAEALNIHFTTAMRICKRYEERGNVKHTRDGTTSKRANAEEVAQLVRIVERHRTMPATQLRHLWGVRGRFAETVSTMTIIRTLRAAGLRSRRPRKMSKLSPAHAVARLNWCNERLTWRMVRWASVLFTDECSMKLFRSDGRMRVWRRTREELLNECVMGQLQGGGGSVLMWAGIHLTGKTRLVFCDRVNGENYTALLRNVCIPYCRQHMPMNYILQDDNAPPHRAEIVKNYKTSAGVTSLPWPSRSADLNPIENIWSILKDRVNKRNPSATTIQELKQHLEEEWENLQHRYVANCISSIPRRLNAVVESQGWYTKY